MGDCVHDFPGFTQKEIMPPTTRAQRLTPKKKPASAQRLKPKKKPARKKPAKMRISDSEYSESSCNEASTADDSDNETSSSLGSEDEERFNRFVEDIRDSDSDTSQRKVSEEIPVCSPPRTRKKLRKRKTHMSAAEREILSLRQQLAEMKSIYQHKNVSYTVSNDLFGYYI